MTRTDDTKVHSQAPMIAAEARKFDADAGKTLAALSADHVENQQSDKIH
jgi:hypothetical protein